MFQDMGLDFDAERLEALQKNAQDAPGQMAAIQAANQLAANQASQLMQIRALLIAQCSWQGDGWSFARARSREG